MQVLQPPKSPHHFFFGGRKLSGGSKLPKVDWIHSGTVDSEHPDHSFQQRGGLYSRRLAWVSPRVGHAAAKVGSFEAGWFVGNSSKHKNLEALKLPIFFLEAYFKRRFGVGMTHTYIYICLGGWCPWRYEGEDEIRPFDVILCRVLWVSVASEPQSEQEKFLQAIKNQFVFGCSVFVFSQSMTLKQTQDTNSCRDHDLAAVDLLSGAQISNYFW